jgi:hypothetical protein
MAAAETEFDIFRDLVKKTFRLYKNKTHPKLECIISFAENYQDDYIFEEELKDLNNRLIQLLN